MNIKTILDKALRENKPTNMAKIFKIIDKLNKSLVSNKLDAKAILGGSVAKGTNLNCYDCDVFVVFDKKYPSNEISNLLLKALSPFNKIKLVHGSRDYYQVLENNTLFEMIPVLKIENASESENITDVSPLHVKWVAENMKNKHDDVRLAKRFCKAQEIYGAESYINGFSGYMLEIMVIAFNGFIPLLKAATEFKPKQIIDIQKSYRNKEDLFKKMNKAKVQSPLIIIDPVQPARNAAAALGEDKFAKFVLAAKLFLNNPSINFFKKKEFSVKSTLNYANKMGYKPVILEIKMDEGKTDVIGSKLSKANEYILNKLRATGFCVLDSGWSWGEKIYFWYLVSPEKLPKYERHKGPLVYSPSKHIHAFIKKHKSFIVENNQLVGFRLRKCNTVEAFLKDILNDKIIKEKVKKIQVLK